MKKCNYCSEILSDNANYCPKCGKKQYKLSYGKDAPLSEHAAAIISYIYWIGFAVSLCLGEKDSEFLKFHQNQSLILHLATIIFWLITYISKIKILYSVGYAVVTVFWIFGIICAARHEVREIPILRKIVLIK